MYLFFIYSIHLLFTTQDAALTQLLSKNATAHDWGNIAASMKEKGHQVRGRECCNRWHVYQKYIHRGMRSCADWTPTEVRIIFLFVFVLFDVCTVVKHLSERSIL